jgi:hypothetical protein
LTDRSRRPVRYANFALRGTAAACYRRTCASLQASTPNVRRYARMALPDLGRGWRAPDQRHAYLDHRPRCASLPQGTGQGDAGDFVMELRDKAVTPHVAQNTNRRRSATRASGHAERLAALALIGGAAVFSRPCADGKPQRPDRRCGDVALIGTQCDRLRPIGMRLVMNSDFSLYVSCPRSVIPI